MKITGPAIVEGPLQAEAEHSEDGRFIKYRLRRKWMWVPWGVTIDLADLPDDVTEQLVHSTAGASDD